MLATTILRSKPALSPSTIAAKEGSKEPSQVLSARDVFMLGFHAERGLMSINLDVQEGGAVYDGRLTS